MSHINMVCEVRAVVQVLVCAVAVCFLDERGLNGDRMTSGWPITTKQPISARELSTQT